MEADKGPFRADSLRVTLGLEHASAALVDDRYGNNIEVMALQLQVSRAAPHAAMGINQSSNYTFPAFCWVCPRICWILSLHDSLSLADLDQLSSMLRAPKSSLT